MTSDPVFEQQTFTIGQVVAALQPRFPDVSHSSLRFLEREGLIHSLRTTGGHRLYAADEVARIEQIKRWQGERVSLGEIRERLVSLDGLSNPELLAREFVASAVAGDLRNAGDIIEQADRVGVPLDVVFSRVLTPALVDIGERWALGEVSVAREKEVSELTRELIVELTRRHEDPDPQGPTVVAACVEGERHELGLRMIVGLLRARGYRVYFLGADVDVRFLLDSVKSRKPSIVLLSTRHPDARAHLEEALSDLSALDGSFKTIVGGSLAASDPSAVEKFGAIASRSGDPATAVDFIESVVHDREPIAGPEREA